MTETLPPITTLQWQTVFSQISAELNNIPLAAGASPRTHTGPFEVLSPNRLLTGRNHQRFAHYVATLDPSLPSHLLQQNQQIVSVFMSHLASSIMCLNSRPSKWPTKQSDPSPPRVGDIVFVLKNEDNAGETWSLARIAAISDNGRKLELTVPKPGGVGTTRIIRSPRNCVLIDGLDSMPLNSTSYYQLFHDQHDNAND